MIVLDSSFLIAYHNEKDVHHDEATEVMGRVLAGEWGPALLPEYVFLEVTTVIRMRLGLDTALEVGELLLRAREIDFVPCSPLFLEALDIFSRERHSELSFVDAAIAALARRHPPGVVASFDDDFRALEGVVAVP